MISDKKINKTFTQLIGVSTLLSFLPIQSFGAPDGGPGNPRTFTNPFANAQGGTPPPAFFEDDAEEEFEFPDDVPAPGKFGGGHAAGGDRDALPSRGSGGGPGGANGIAGQQTPSGISLGGSAAGGVIQGRNKQKPITLDAETGEGSKETVTDFNFPDADILDIAKTLGKLTEKNFILDKDVKGRVSIISNSPITVGDAWKAFLTALDMNGFALIPSGKYIRIARRRDARDKQLRTYTGDFSPDTDALITRVFPLKYLSAEEVARNFRMFMPGDSRIIPYEQTNTVIVTDTGSNIAKLSKLLEILDVEGYDAGIEVIPVKFASAVEFSKLIDTLIPGSGGGGGMPGGMPRMGGGGKFMARRTKEGGIINTIIADERTNTLIVHANNRGADQVRELVKKLDQKLPTTSGGGKVHVIYLQFADAEQIAGTLNNLSQQSAQRPPSSGMMGGAGGLGINPVAQSLFEGNIRVSADKSTNSLVVTGSPSDFVTVQRVVNRLDIPRDEVYVEAVIMELSNGRTVDFNSGVVAPKYGVALDPGVAGSGSNASQFWSAPPDPKTLTGIVIGNKTASNISVTIGDKTISLPSLAAVFRWLTSTNQANILATPQIMAMDNTEATFETGEKVYYPTQTMAQAVTTTQFQSMNVSLSLTIKPQINKVSNFVKLDITAKLADFSNRQVANAAQGQPPGTSERSAKTSVVVGDSDTVVIGGLMRETQNEVISKVPILGDIPLLGWLFRATVMSRSKTNLMIFMTPKIVRNYEKVRDILNDKLKKRQAYVEASPDGKDPFKDELEEMMRPLPDLKELMNQKVERTALLDGETKSVPAPGELPAGENVPAALAAPPVSLPSSSTGVPIIPAPITPAPMSAAPAAAPVPAPVEAAPQSISEPPAASEPPPTAGDTPQGGVSF